MPSRIAWMLAVTLAVGGCHASRPAALPDGAARPAGTPSFENVHAALWTASAVEFRASAEQAYRLAHLQLDRALADTSWTAALEQTGSFGGLRPAIILDADETVLDNLAYQARLILSGTMYAAETWDAWVAEAAATAIPGALEFTRYAASKGVRVVYLTNRDGKGEAATRRNLAALGFPLTDDPDVVLTQNERPEWRASDKGPRRAHVAASHRIVLLVGDNLGDFLSDRRADLAGRDSLYAAHAPWWGERWIMLPNPQYGSWESAAFGHDYALSPEDRMARKLELIGRRAIR